MAKFNRKIIAFGAGLALFFGAGFAVRAEAAGASLYLSPNNGTFTVGGTFDVSVFANTGNNNVNAVKVELKFDPQKLQIANPAAGKSFISIWIAPPSYSNTEGVLSFQGGVPTPGINTSSGLISTITFRAVTPGETKIYFLNSSKMLLDDGKGTDILSSLGKGEYAIAILPPEGPRVFSPTHSDMNKWYKNNNPTFSWEREDGVSDFSYSIDFDSQGVPDNISEGSNTSVSYSDLKDGIWYFHIKAKKGDIWGGASHYLAQIDRTWPAEFSIEVNPSAITDFSQPIISFMNTDSLSGLDHFEVKSINITPDNKEGSGSFFVEAASPYKMPPLKTGKYMIAVRAYDKAGNWRDETAKIEIVPGGTVFMKDGLWIRGMFLSWRPFLILLPIILFLIIIYSVYRWKKRKLEEELRIRILQEKEREMQSHINKMNNLEQ